MCMLFYDSIDSFTAFFTSEPNPAVDATKRPQQLPHNSWPGASSPPMRSAESV